MYIHNPPSRLPQTRKTPPHQSQRAQRAQHAQPPQGPSHAGTIAPDLHGLTKKDPIRFAMSSLAQTLTAALKAAVVQPSPVLARPAARGHETAAEVAGDYARRHRMRAERDAAYWAMMYEQERLLETGRGTREGLERATMEWLRKYPAP